MREFPCLETLTFLAFIADNSSLGIHGRNYNGVASLIPRQSGNNLFVPTAGGLNFEYISLTGLPPYRYRYEPRFEAMHIEGADDKSVVLVQPETSHAHISTRITFSIEEPHYLHQRIELTFHRLFCGHNEQSIFRGLFASYIHVPPDRHIYLKPDYNNDNNLVNWFGITKTDHSARQLQIRLLPDNCELDAAMHLYAMTSQKPLYLTQDELVPLQNLDVPESLESLAFYYGFCHGSQTFLMMFKQPERVQLAYSPTGAGKQPPYSPAWDYILALDDVQLGNTYIWDVCLAVKPFQGRADIVDEVRRFLRH